MEYLTPVEGPQRLGDSLEMEMTNSTAHFTMPGTTIPSHRDLFLHLHQNITISLWCASDLKLVQFLSETCTFGNEG